ERLALLVGAPGVGAVAEHLGEGALVVGRAGEQHPLGEVTRGVVDVEQQLLSALLRLLLVADTVGGTLDGALGVVGDLLQEVVAGVRHLPDLVQVEGLALVLLDVDGGALGDLALAQLADGGLALLDGLNVGAELADLGGQVVPLGLALLGERGVARTLVDRAKGVLSLSQAGLHLFESHVCLIPSQIRLSRLSARSRAFWVMPVEVPAWAASFGSSLRASSDCSAPTAGATVSSSDALFFSEPALALALSSEEVFLWSPTVCLPSTLSQSQGFLGSTSALAPGFGFSLPFSGGKARSISLTSSAV